MKYETKGALKFAERDIFTEGCISDTAYSVFVDNPLQSDNLAQILKSISDFTGCEVEDIEVNACEEPGRIDAAVMETAEGFAATPHQLERWKTGDCDLWYAVYSFYFEGVTRAPANFETVGALQA